MERGKRMTRTIAFHTFGCKVNQYETEELREQFKLGGYKVVPMDSTADVNVINSCTVTADADSTCRQLVRKLLRGKEESRVIVTGCYAERAAEELRAISPRVEVFGNHEKPMIAITLGVPTACVQEAAQSGVTALAERTRAYIKIQDGCDAKCTYCIIPSVRPHLICRSPELILEEAQNLLAKGFKEIVLTGVRLGRYEWTSKTSSPAGSGRGSIDSPPVAAGTDDFCTLLISILNLPGDFRIRLSSIEVTEIPDEVIKLAAHHPKLCPFFHIPLQSGDDEILKRMGRWYSANEYRDRIRFIKAQVPEVALSADVIVGFAGETENHFQNTVELLENEGFSRVHAFRYSIRPGTPAERLSNHIDPRIKGERTRAMVQVDKSLRRRYAERFLHKSVRVLVEADGSGYSERYVRVRVGEGTPEGQWKNVQPCRVDQDAVLWA
jgi:threonylcarbamoyladenosine tRNA methylthiotransferase MtaB